MLVVVYLYSKDTDLYISV